MKGANGVSDGLASLVLGPGTASQGREKHERPETSQRATQWTAALTKPYGQAGHRAELVGYMLSIMGHRTQEKVTASVTSSKGYVMIE